MNTSKTEWRTMKHIRLVVTGYALAQLLIFLLPAMGVGSGWVVATVIGAMMLCHLMHFGTRVYVSVRVCGGSGDINDRPASR